MSDFSVSLNSSFWESTHYGQKHFLLNCSIMLSAHPSPPLAPSHTHRVSACPAYPSTLKKHPFLFYFETCEGLLIKGFSLLQTFQFSCSVMSNSLCNMDFSTPGFPVHHQLPELAQTQVHWIGDAIQSSHPPSSSSLAFHLSQHQDLFQWVSFHIRWPNYWRFSFSISPFNEYFLQDCLIWFPCSPKDSQLSSPTAQFKSIILWCSAFFIVQLSHPNMTIGWS